MIFTDGFALREAVNNGARSMKEVADLVRQSRRFRDWLSNQEPSSPLIGQYIEAINRETWAGLLPVKLLRWSIAIMVGLVNPPAGIIVTTADTFLTERMARGWPRISL